MDAVIVPLGDTTFNNLSIVIDGKDEESERFLTAGVLPINPGGKFAFEGDTYIEMKNIKGRQMVAGVFDFLSEAPPEMAATVTTDNIGILQENINSENLFGLISGNLETSGDLEITQNNNSGSITGVAVCNTVTIGGDVTITQNGNSGSLYGAQIQSIIGKENSSLNVNQTNGDFSDEAIGLTHPIKGSAHYQNIAINITQQNLFSSSANSTSFLRGMGNASDKFSISGNLPINIVQKNNYATGIYGLHAQVTAEHSDMPVTIIQTDNSYHLQNYQTFSAITGDNNFTNVTIAQENNTITR